MKKVCSNCGKVGGNGKRTSASARFASSHDTVRETVRRLTGR